MSIQRQKLTSKDKIKELYSEFDFNNEYTRYYAPIQRSSYGINCSDEKLKLYDIMLLKSNAEQKSQPKDFAAKLKQVKGEYLSHNPNNAMPPQNNILNPFTKMKAIDNYANDKFKQKFYELAKLSGNEIHQKKEKTIHFFAIPTGKLNDRKSNQQMKKSDLLKKQIMVEISKDGEYGFGNATGRILKRGKSAGSNALRKEFKNINTYI